MHVNFYEKRSFTLNYLTAVVMFFAMVVFFITAHYAQNAATQRFQGRIATLDQAVSRLSAEAKALDLRVGDVTAEAAPVTKHADWFVIMRAISEAARERVWLSVMDGNTRPTAHIRLEGHSYSPAAIQEFMQEIKHERQITAIHLREKERLLKEDGEDGYRFVIECEVGL